MHLCVSWWERERADGETVWCVILFSVWDPFLALFLSEFMSLLEGKRASGNGLKSQEQMKEVKGVTEIMVSTLSSSLATFTQMQFK